MVIFPRWSSFFFLLVKGMKFDFSNVFFWTGTVYKYSKYKVLNFLSLNETGKVMFWIKHLHRNVCNGS